MNEFERVQELFQQIMADGIVPDVKVYTSLIGFAAHTGDLNGMEAFYQQMLKQVIISYLYYSYYNHYNNNNK